MNNNIDIKTLEAFQDGNHKAFYSILQQNQNIH